MNICNEIAMQAHAAVVCLVWLGVIQALAWFGLACAFKTRALLQPAHERQRNKTVWHYHPSTTRITYFDYFPCAATQSRWCPSAPSNDCLLAHTSSPNRQRVPFGVGVSGVIFQFSTTKIAKLTHSCRWTLTSKKLLTSENTVGAHTHTPV